MAKKKILIVDDEKNFTRMVKLNLEATGQYDVMIENDAKSVLKTAQEYMPDLVLLDVIMPDIEGPDVLCQLRQHETFRHTPVVFLTATVTKEEVNSQEGFIGGHVFLAKPGSVSELVTCIERQLAEKDGQARQNPG